MSLLLVLIASFNICLYMLDIFVNDASSIAGSEGVAQENFSLKSFVFLQLMSS